MRECVARGGGGHGGPGAVRGGDEGGPGVHGRARTTKVRVVG